MQSSVQFSICREIFLAHFLHRVQSESIIDVEILFLCHSQTVHVEDRLEQTVWLFCYIGHESHHLFCNFFISVNLTVMQARNWKLLKKICHLSAIIIRWTFLSKIESLFSFNCIHVGRWWSTGNYIERIRWWFTDKNSTCHVNVSCHFEYIFKDMTTTYSIVISTNFMTGVNVHSNSFEQCWHEMAWRMMFILRKELIREKCHRSMHDCNWNVCKVMNALFLLFSEKILISF